MLFRKSNDDATNGSSQEIQTTEDMQTPSLPNQVVEAPQGQESSKVDTSHNKQVTKYVLIINCILFSILISYRIFLTVVGMLHNQHSFEDIIWLSMLVTTFVLVICAFKNIYDKVVKNDESTVIQRIGVITSIIGIIMVSVHILFPILHQHLFGAGLIVTFVGVEMSSSIIISSLYRMLHWIGTGK